MTVKKPYFISDAHFGIDLPGCEDRERLFFRFLTQHQAEISHLYILGDLFDFWIDYRCAIRPDYFNVLHHLKSLVDRGIEVHYLAGNHDFALGTFLNDQIGITTYPAELSCTIQGKNVLMLHGDGLIGKDITYRILKKLLRSPFNQRIYKLLHPDFGVPFGSSVSGSSRKYLNKPIGTLRRKEYAGCARQMLQKGNDIVLFGHIHQPELVRFPEGLYCNTGSWLKHYTYATMVDGALHLHRFHEDGEDELLPESDLNTGSSIS